MSNLKKILKSFFRCIVFGSTGSGKSYMVINNLIPKIHNNYDNIIIFTREEMKNKYEKDIYDKTGKHPVIYIDEDSEGHDIVDSEFPSIINKIIQTQKKNIKGYTSTNDTVYNSNILIVFDDIVSEYLFKTPEFLKIFFNTRKLQMSTILISQTVTNEVNNRMKSNCEVFFLFGLNNTMQERYIYDLIRCCLMSGTIDPKYKKYLQEHHKKYENTINNLHRVYSNDDLQNEESPSESDNEEEDHKHGSKKLIETKIIIKPDEFDIIEHYDDNEKKAYRDAKLLYRYFVKSEKARDEHSYMCVDNMNNLY